MKRLICCPACLQGLGTGYQEDVEQLSLAHVPHCTASDDEHRQALTNAVFRTMTKDLNL